MPPACWPNSDWMPSNSKAPPAMPAAVVAAERRKPEPPDAIIGMPCAIIPGAIIGWPAQGCATGCWYCGAGWADAGRLQGPEGVTPLAGGGALGAAPRPSNPPRKLVGAAAGFAAS